MLASPNFLYKGEQNDSLIVGVESNIAELRIRVQHETLHGWVQEREQSSFSSKMKVTEVSVATNYGIRFVSCDKLAIQRWL